MVELSGVALILGASSGFGAATARALAREGMDIVGVHLDRRATIPVAQRVADDVRTFGRRSLFFNVNAADDGKRIEVLDALSREFGGGSVRVLLHSLAFGTLKPLCGDGAVSRAQLEMTLDVMASSLVYWTADLVQRGLFAEGARVLAMTSSGGTRAIPSYGPVGAAKAALESYCRQLALELGPRGIAVNAIRAGVTETPALEKIPGAEEMVRVQRQKNPARRLTTPDDVAEAIALLARPGARWISGNTLGIDGGEDIVA
jgi:NAD(P)-dependent dehydrogenase (short-subunit alcohol dehydrogenase family)